MGQERERTLSGLREPFFCLHLSGRYQGAGEGEPHLALQEVLCFISWSK